MEDRTIQICKQLAEWLASSPEVEITGEPNAYMASLVKVRIRSDDKHNANSV